MCRHYRVSRSGYYAWQSRQPSDRERTDRRLSVQIERIFASSGGTYGSPRIHAVLARKGTRIGRKRVARLMRQAGLKARAARIYRRSPGIDRFFGEIPNLVLGLATSRTDQVWVGDITYLTGNGRRYLAVVMDRHSRRILAWKVGPRRDIALTRAVLDRAVRRRRPARGVIFHSDRGSEYSGYAYRDRLLVHGILQSMKRPRELADNAYIESFFGSLKADTVHGRLFKTDRELEVAIGSYIRRYNRSRLHSSLGYRSPIDYERASA